MTVNMQHVMFENTHAALLECFEHMMDPNVSRSEREFRRSLLALCANAVNAFGDGTEDPDGLVEAEGGAYDENHGYPFDPNDRNSIDAFFGTVDGAVGADGYSPGFDGPAVVAKNPLAQELAV